VVGLGGLQLVDDVVVNELMGNVIGEGVADQGGVQLVVGAGGANHARWHTRHAWWPYLAHLVASELDADASVLAREQDLSLEGVLGLQSCEHFTVLDKADWCGALVAEHLQSLE